MPTYSASTVIVANNDRPRTRATIRAAADTSKDRLATLPAELRSEIYGMVLTHPKPHWETVDKNKTANLAGRWREPALLQVSKQIRAEESSNLQRNQ